MQKLASQAEFYVTRWPKGMVAQRMVNSPKGSQTLVPDGHCRKARGAGSPSRGCRRKRETERGEMVRHASGSPRTVPSCRPSPQPESTAWRGPERKARHGDHCPWTTCVTLGSTETPPADALPTHTLGAAQEPLWPSSAAELEV